MPKGRRVIPLVDSALPAGYWRLYTDGAVKHPGAKLGAAAWLVVDQLGEPLTWDVVVEFSDHQLNNNAMEVLAISRGLLSVLKAPGQLLGIEVNTDSSFAVGLLWLGHQLRCRDQLTMQLVRQAHDLIDEFPVSVTYRMIKAHPRVQRRRLVYPYAMGNVIVDQLCTQAMEEISYGFEPPRTAGDYGTA